MEEKVWFAPARPVPPEGPLARYRPPALAGAAKEFVARLTAPTDLVLDLFCQGPAFVRQALRVGRRAVGVSVNPVGLLVAGVGLEPLPPPAALDAAFTRLADSPKRDLPLSRYVTGFYRSRCPACAAQGTAVWFAWDREALYPYAKAVRCSHCDGVQEGPTDEQDIAAARQFERKSPAYHYALSRVAPVDHPARDRAADLVELYTPRNLSALIDVTMRLEGLDLKRPVRAALQTVLIEVFDRASSLDPPGEARPRPRTLRIPVRFLERNVWLLLEEALSRLTGWAGEGISSVRRAPSLQALLDSRISAYALVPSAAREVGELLPPGATTLILADPPRPDGVYWALCALWAGWLWDTSAAHAMRPLLGRRRFDWEWHQRALRTALAAALPLLAPDGRLLTLFAEDEERLMESVCLAASGAGYELTGWGVDPGAGRQLVWRVPEHVAVRGVEPLEEELLTRNLTQSAAELAQLCLRERAEPTPWTVVHGAIYAGLSSRGLLAQADALPRHVSPPVGFTADAVHEGLEQLGLEAVDDEKRKQYWLSILDREEVEPLADRVEESVWKMLQSQPLWTKKELLRRIYSRFRDLLTPDPSLVLACLRSYDRGEEGGWRLREEDDPHRRAEELKALRKDLRALGELLEFQVGRGQGWDVRWQKGGRDVYLFVLSPTAALGRYLLFGPSIPDEACPCLVFPGGRAELLAYKLQRDPRLARLAEEEGWEFIKFRHLRRLMSEGSDRRAFEAVLRLDPVTEGEGVQIPLLLGGEK